MFDLKSVTTSLTAEVQILHPITKEETGAVIVVAGPEHPKRKALIFETQRKLRKAFQKKGSIDLSSDPEDDEIERNNNLAACTLGWSGFTKDGQQIEFSEKAAQQLYADPELSWVRDQVQEALNVRENFIQTSAPN